MYFLRIKPLKETLASAGISPKEQFKYLMAWMLLLTWASSIPARNPGFWETTSGWAVLVITFLGILYAYFRNGGSAGAAFLDRYLSIGWVVNVRIFLILVAVILGGTYILGLLGYHPGGYYGSQEGAWQAILTIIAEIYVAISIGKHIGQVRKDAETKRGLEALPFSSIQMSERLKKFEEAVTQREMPLIRVDTPWSKTRKKPKKQRARPIKVRTGRTRT